jgi:hypothetical protein
MLIGKYLRRMVVSSVIGLPLLAAGCTENPRDVGVPAGKATAATEIGGGATTASPGGPNVGPTGASTVTGAGTNPGGR